MLLDEVLDKIAYNLRVQRIFLNLLNSNDESILEELKIIRKEIKNNDDMDPIKREEWLQLIEQFISEYETSVAAQRSFPISLKQEELVQDGE